MKIKQEEQQLDFVWDFELLNFEFVSNFGFRASDLFFYLRVSSRYSRLSHVVSSARGAFFIIV